MNIQQIESIIDGHAQKYQNSCSPSLAEMLLKLSGAVSADYYDEQHRDQNDNVGLSNINNRTLAGQTFRRLQDTPSSNSFHGRINELLTTGKPVGIYLPTQLGFHGFVIAGIEHGLYILLSKESERGNGEGARTIKVFLTEAQIDAYYDRDCIYLE
jgi:hypothetical protein